MSTTTDPNSRLRRPLTIWTIRMALTVAGVSLYAPRWAIAVTSVAVVVAVSVLAFKAGLACGAAHARRAGALGGGPRVDQK